MVPLKVLPNLGDENTAWAWAMDLRDGFSMAHKMPSYVLLRLILFKFEHVSVIHHMQTDERRKTEKGRYREI